MAQRSKDADEVRSKRGETLRAAAPAAKPTPRQRRTKMLQPAPQPDVGIDLHRRRSVIVPGCTPRRLKGTLRRPADNLMI